MIMPDWIAKYWIEWLFGVIAAGLIAYIRIIAKQVKKEREEQKALRDGMRSLLRRQIIMDCEHAIAEGYCPMARKDTIADMYKSYHALGGNGVVTGLKDQTMKLSSVKESETHGKD